MPPRSMRERPPGAREPELARSLQTFFLGCVIVAGVYGGATAKPTILLVQAIPAALALLAVWSAG